MSQLSASNDPPPQIIFVVEDEELLRELLFEVLSGPGRLISTFDTADAGLKAFELGPEIDLLLTDVRTPGLINGWDLAGFVCSSHPNIPVIITSGYCFGTGNQLPPSASFISKPWGLQAMSDMVSKRLSGG